MSGCFSGHGVALRCTQSGVTELTWFSFWQTDQWASSKTLQYRHCLMASVYVHICVNQWPMSSPCSPIGQFVKN